MLRLFGAAGLFVICAAIGRLRAEGYRNRLETLSAYIEDLRAIEVDLRCERCAAATLVKRMANFGRLRNLWQAMANQMNSGCSYGRAWKGARQTLRGLKAEELEIMDQLAEKFGTGDAETELGRTERALGRLELIEKRLGSEYPGRIKLANTLSMLCGLACALLTL